MIIHAGPVVKFIMFILFLFSVVSWAIIFMKWRLLRKAREETAYFLDLFWDTAEMSKVYNESEDLPYSPVANLFRSGYSEIVRMNKIQSQPKGSAGNSSMQPLLDVVERSLKRATIDQGNRLEKALSFLATTGNTAPFIGLFGTVWGIMESFRGIGLKGAANLAVVAPGISEALIATAAGLAAAIPAVVAFNYFNSKVGFLKSEMDNFSSDFLSLVARQFMKKMMSSKEEETGAGFRRQGSGSQESEGRRRTSES
ncbi:MAG: protein TolQ [Deltaproteobacteria bacterium HGW-Deltaproteobacteria-15]|nr:MAG: protein TolQ [Deltaproteobacteria bacterium HGW-Deltaproteobacteria-15]